MADRPIVHALDDLLAASQAAAAFKDDVRALARGAAQDRIEFNSGSPSVKVLRLVAKILEELPAEPIERVRIKGVSGCANYTGTATVTPGDLQIQFDWNCRWRAQEMGWCDPFGDPDQIRAAREFGYQCFKSFKLERPAINSRR